jgi:lipoprotein signal peptidase
VDAGIGELRWYTFNVADTAISVAIILLLAVSLWPAVARRAGVDA